MKMARLATAQTFDEFLADAVRVPIAEAYGNGAVAAGQPTFDADGALVLNERLPLVMLRRAAASTSLPNPSVATCCWRRSCARCCSARRRPFARSCQTCRARCRRSPNALQPLASATDNESLRDEGALLWFGIRDYVRSTRRDGREPRRLARIDSLRDNWWCSFSSTEWPATPYETQYWRGGLDEPARTIYPGTGDMPSPAFLTADERRAAENEWQQLKQLDTAPNEIGRRVLAWAPRASN